MMLKGLMMKKLANPEMYIGYIPRQHKVYRNKHKERRNRLL
jgi:hypothetical protein